MNILEDFRDIHGRVIRRLSSVPADAALRLLNAPPVERRLLRRYEMSRTAYARTLPSLPRCDEAIVRALRDKGFCVTSLDALGLPGTTEMFAQATHLARVLADRLRRVTKSTITASASELLSHPGLFEWGVADRLLRIVEAYLSLPVAYDGLCYFQSRADGRENGIRHWHLDREDRHIIKIGIYVGEVGPDDGPLQLLPRGLTSRLGSANFHYKPLTQAEIERRLGVTDVADAVATVTGPPGTVVLIDTAQHYHRGSPPVARDRSAIYYHYFSRVPRHPFYCERSPFSRAQLAMLAERLPPLARDAVLWRRQLPRGVRLIPPSRA